MPSSRPEPSPQSVRTLSSGIVVLCPICGKVPLQGRQEVCSGMCRIKRSRQRRAAKQHERDAQVRLLLTTAIEAATEAKALLKPDKEPPS